MWTGRLIIGAPTPEDPAGYHKWQHSDPSDRRRERLAAAEDAADEAQHSDERVQLPEDRDNRRLNAAETDSLWMPLPARFPAGRSFDHGRHLLIPRVQSVEFLMTQYPISQSPNRLPRIKNCELRPEKRGFAAFGPAGIERCDARDFGGRAHRYIARWDDIQEPFQPSQFSYCNRAVRRAKCPAISTS
jgi:hypothetical protein